MNTFLMAGWPASAVEDHDLTYFFSSKRERGLAQNVNLPVDSPDTSFYHLYVLAFFIMADKRCTSDSKTATKQYDLRC